MSIPSLRNGLRLPDRTGRSRWSPCWYTLLRRRTAGGPPTHTADDDDVERHLQHLIPWDRGVRHIRQPAQIPQSGQRLRPAEPVTDLLVQQPALYQQHR